ncbi:MAG: tyrosine-type recombinase/integrase, partial [Desulfococcaceae bacterium]
MSDIYNLKENMDIFQSIEVYFKEMNAIGSLSSTSIRNRRYELNRFAAFCKTHKIELVHEIHKNLIISYLNSLKVAKSTRSHIMYILSGFLDYLVREELLIDNYAALIEKPKVYLPKTDYLNFEELERLYQNEAGHASRKTVDRNLLLFSLFTDICLRVSEAIQLKMDDVRLASGEIWVTRKRGKVDRIPISGEIVDQFLNWYEMRVEYKNEDLDWVFLSTHGKPLTSRQVHAVVSSALRRAGLIKRKQGPHLLRHSGASLKAQAGENLIMIQYL